MSSLHVLYASTSGHTEYVVETVSQYLSEKGVEVTTQRAEKATEEDFKKGDFLLLASSSWNTGSIEGQLNPHMYDLLLKKVKGIDLGGRKVCLIGLGDERYRYTCKAADHLEEFIKTHGGEHVGSTLRIINEPYHQDEVIRKWADELLPLLTL